MNKLRMIAVAGMIGVGKTTLASNLSKVLGAGMICEEYDQNPFLADQLAGDREAALASEMFFLFSRVRQLNSDPLINEKHIVCDYVFQKNRIFAKMNLDEEQFALYDQLEALVLPKIVRPDAVVYLTDTVENCLDRIHRRGRPMEMRIQASWLNRLEKGYDELFQGWVHCPVIRLDCSRQDIRQIEVVKSLADKLTDRSLKAGSELIRK